MRFWLSFLVCLTASAQPNPAGYVLKMEGSWQAKSAGGSTRTLSPGQLVFAGEALTAESADAPIALVLYNGTYLRCPKGTNCTQPVQIPAAARPQGFWAAFVDRIQNRHLPPLSFVTSRGVGKAPVQLHDAVLAAGTGTVDLSPVLTAPPAIPLHLILEPLEQAKECKPIEFRLPPGSRSIALPDLRPGCFGLYQLAAMDEVMEAAYPATVLFVAPPHLPEASRMLSDAIAISSNWQGSREDERRSFVRMSLSAIRQSLQPRK